MSITDTPSQKAGDLAVSLIGNGFLYVDDSKNPILNIQTNALTLETWVKIDPTDTRAYEGLIAYGSSYKMGLQNGALVFTLYGIVDMPSGITVPLGEWHHVASAWEPGVGVTFYIDGVSVANVADTSAMRAFGNNLLSIGAETAGGSVLGSLDRVRIHKGLLTPEQLDSVADTPKAVYANTLVSYNFNESQPPYQNATTASRPTFNSAEYFSAQKRPAFSTDTPTGGQGDYSLQFTATSSIHVDDPNAVVTLDTGDFTFQAWVKPGIQPGTRAVLFLNNGLGGAVSCAIAADRTLFVTALGKLDQPSKAKIGDDGAWHHIAIEQETGKEFRFYVDGTLSDTVAYTGGVLIGERTDTFFVLGAENDSLHYVGLMDRVSFTKGLVAAKDLDFRAIPGVDPSAPSLAIQPKMELSWPTVPVGYKLQSSTNITDATSWMSVTNAPIIENNTYKVYLPSSANKAFYRLSK